MVCTTVFLSACRDWRWWRSFTKLFPGQCVYEVSTHVNSPNTAMKNTSMTWISKKEANSASSWILRNEQSHVQFRIHRGGQRSTKWGTIVIIIDYWAAATIRRDLHLREGGPVRGQIQCARWLQTAPMTARANTKSNADPDGRRRAYVMPSGMQNSTDRNRTFWRQDGRDGEQAGYMKCADNALP